MRTTSARHLSRLSGTVAIAGLLIVCAAPAALAQTAEYTGTGDVAEDTGVLSGSTGRTVDADTSVNTSATTSSSTSTTPSTLPFTGGEVVLIAAAGGAALAAGAGMLVAGRRHEAQS